MRKTNKLLAIFMAIIMVLPFIPFSVFAVDTYTYTLTFTVAAGTNHTIAASMNGALPRAGEIKIDGQNFVTLKDGTGNNANSIGEVTVAADGKSATIFVKDGPKGYLTFGGDAYSLSMDNNLLAAGTEFTTNKAITVQNYVAPQPPPANNPGNNQQQTGKENATVTVSGTNKTEAGIAINDEFVDLFEFPEPTNITRNISYNYDSATANGKVKIRFETRHNMKYNGTITINNVTYQVKDYLDYTKRDEYLNHYNGQMVSFEIEVAKADNYNIAINVDRADENTTWIGNFLWTGDPTQEFLTTSDGNKVPNDDYIGHAKLEIVKIEYVRNGKIVSKTVKQLTDLGEQEIGPDIYYHNYTDGDVEYGYLTKLNNKAVNYDDGSLVVPEGAKVTMRIVPEYGYQVTSFGINGNDVITGDNISEFTFTVGKGNFHLGAQVTKVDNTVKTDTNAVKSGTIQMGNKEIATGTARLEVADANVTDEKKAEFSEKIGAQYELSEILNISLSQVFYKGTANDVWTGDAIEDLKEEAIISLVLSEDIDPDNTIIYHNIHDGEEYEEIEILSYDKETRTLTIKVKSFSNYAIATKVSDKTGKSPKTGDTIEIFFTTFAVAAVAMGTVFVIRRKR